MTPAFIPGEAGSHTISVHVIHSDIRGDRANFQHFHKLPTVSSCWFFRQLFISFHLSSIQILEEIELIFNAFTSCQLFHLFCSLDSFFLSFHLLSIQISEEIELIFQCFHKLPNVSPRLFFRQLFSCFF